MQLQQVHELDVVTIGNMEEGISATIDKASEPFVFRMVSKQLYSNPEGSVVREITTNGFDANKEANNLVDPVIITKGVDTEEGEFISFQDFGTGMRPYIMDKVYSKYFSSTKRNDNTLHGGFGLGSKTPLAYTDLFYITTVWDGTKYEYFYHVGDEKPTLESIYGWEKDKAIEWETIPNPKLTDPHFIEDENNPEPETITIPYKYRVAIGKPTEERNGTTVKIFFKGRDDIEKFKTELKFQLTYFDNVYFVNWGISNDYTIYEGQHFKYRADIDAIRTLVHVCLGKVRYPIDFNKVNIPKEFQHMPIAVKFEIGELAVTLSRENLEYKDKSIKLIREKVLLAGQELLAKFEAQNPEVDTLEEWRRVANDVPMIYFDKEKYKHWMTLWSYSGLKKGFVFRPFKDLGIKKTPANIFFMWEAFAYINRGSGTREDIHNLFSYSRIDNDFIMNKNYLIWDKHDKVSTYTDLYIAKNATSDTYLIRRKEVTDQKKHYAEIATALQLDEAKLIAGKAKTVLGYIKKVSDLVKNRAAKNMVNERGFHFSSTEERLTHYSQWRASDEWIAEYKRSIIESTAAWKRKKANRIFFRYVNGGSGEMTEYEFATRTGILVYGYKEDKAILHKIYKAISHRMPMRRQGRKESNEEFRKRADKPFMCIIIARAAEEFVKGPKKTMYWKNFIERTSYFKKFYTANCMRQKLWEFESTLECRTFREGYLKDYKQDLGRVETVIAKYVSYDSFNFSSSFTENLAIVPSMMKIVDDFIAKYSFRIPLVKGLTMYSLNKEDTTIVMNIIKARKIRLKAKYYMKSVEQLAEQQEHWNFLKGMRTIFDTLNNTQIKLLTLKQNNDGNENTTTDGLDLHREEDGGELCSNLTGEGQGRCEVREESFDGTWRNPTEEDRTVQQEAEGDLEDTDYQSLTTGSSEEERREGSEGSEGEGGEATDQESLEEIFL